MISYLTGQVVNQKNKIIILTGGVGYGVFIGPRLLAKAQTLKEIELFIYTHVKEDKLDLYGFESEKELSLFEMVLDISGVGPKTAVVIVDGGTDKLIDAVQNARTSYFQSIPRIGKKMAQKIIIELKSKLGSLKELDLTPISQEQQDIVDALLSLGFDEVAIHETIRGIEIDGRSAQEVIKLAIKILSK
jgi:holliday junction DNA helicase RuvA